MNSGIEKYLSGDYLYGDDFDSRSIEKWYADEEDAYYELTHHFTEYEYYSFNDYYAYSTFGGRKFKTCLAFGCANGDDVKSIAEIVSEYIALEPAEKWWAESIGGKPARYVKPAVSGNIPLNDDAVDLAVCLGVLHHIPNVSYVIAEIYRVLERGGILVLREPIFSMGDWRNKRKGLTSRERGIPRELLVNILVKAGFEIISAKPCMVPTTPKIANLFGIKNAYNSRLMVVIDRISSLILQWNIRYHRKNMLEKLAPTSLYILAKKN